MDYMNKRGGTIILEGIEAPKFKINSIRDALLEALNMEKKVNNVGIKRQNRFLLLCLKTIICF